MLKKILLVLSVILLTCYGLWHLSSARNMQLFGELISRVDTTEKIIALTFDDGPSKHFTDEVLQILVTHNVKGTFFVTGAEIAANQAQAKQLVAAGHQLGNHSYSHSRMLFMSQTTIANEIEQTDLLIRQVGYQGDIHFRPPYGKKLFTLPWYLQQHQRLSILWDLEPESDKKLAQDAQAMANYVLENAKPGSILLLHVMYKSRETSRQALPLIITGLKQQGYRFVTVNELLSIQRAIP